MSEADHIARESAARALFLIEAHERVCTERQTHILQGLAEIKDHTLAEMRADIKGLYARFWLAALSIITMLMGACGALIYLVLIKAR